MERRMTGNCHVRCEAGEKGEITSNPYLSLLAFPTIMAYEIIFSTTSMRQFFRRSWRPKQTEQVRVFQYCWEHAKLSAGTMETRGLELIAVKAAVSMMLEGKLPPAESLARQVQAKGGASDPMMELALAMVDANGEEQMRVKGSIEEAFRQMNEDAELEVFDEEPEAGEAEEPAIEINREVVSTGQGTRQQDRSKTKARQASRLFHPSLFDTPAPSVAGVQAIPLFALPGEAKSTRPGVPQAAPVGRNQESAMRQPVGKKWRKRAKQHSFVPLFEEALAPRSAEPAEKKRQDAPGKGHQSSQPNKDKGGKQSKRQRQQGQPKEMVAEQPSMRLEPMVQPRPVFGTNTGAGRQPAPLAFGQPPALQREQPDAGGLTEGPLWTFGEAEEPLEPERDLAAREFDTHTALVSSEQTPPVTPPSEQQELLAEETEPVELDSGAETQESVMDDEVCVACGAEVELYTPEGIPYCFAHAPKAVQPNGEQTQEEASAEVWLPSPAMGEQRVAIALDEVKAPPLNEERAQEEQQDAVPEVQLPMLDEEPGVAQVTDVPPAQPELAGAKRTTAEHSVQALHYLDEEAAQPQMLLGSGTFRLEGEEVIVSFHRGDKDKVRTIKGIRDRYRGRFEASPPRWVLPITALNDVICEFPDLESVA